MTAVYATPTPINAWNCDHAPGNGILSSIKKCGALLPSLGVSGSGSDTSGQIVLQGFSYLAGQAVSVLICGYDCGDYTVDTYGQVTVPLGSSTITAAELLTANDPGAYGDAEACIWLTVSSVVNEIYVPVVIGSAYSSQGQMLRPLMTQGLSESGPALGMTRRSHMFAMHLVNVSQIQVGTSFSDLYAVSLQSSDGVTIAAGTSYSGVVWGTLADDYSFDSMFCWQINRPFAAIVVSVNVFVEAQER